MTPQDVKDIALDVLRHRVILTYEAEAEDRLRSLIGLIQPAMTLIIGLIVGFLTLAMISAMYSLYGQVL